MVLYSPDTYDSLMKEGAEAEAEKLGVKMSITIPQKFDAVLQTSAIDALIAKKVDGIIAAPADGTALIPPLERANDAGIGVVTIDAPIGDGNYESGEVTFPISLVASNNELAGEKGCEALIEEIGGEGKIYIEDVQPGILSSSARREGCEKVIEATGGKVELAGVGYDEETVPKAQSDTAAALQREPDINGVFGTDGYSSQGAAQAVEQAHLTGQVKVVYFDADEEGIELLEKGTVSMVLAQEPKKMGELSVKAMVEALEGKTPEKKISTGVEVITKENVKDPKVAAYIY
jgi:ribose transport system substrate-binding protein